MPTPVRRLISAVAALVALALLLPGAAPSGALEVGLSAVHLGGARVSRQLATDLATLPGDAPYSGFVSFVAGADFDAAVADMRDRGLVVGREYRSVGGVFAAGTVADWGAATSSPFATYLEENRKIAFLGDTSAWATRVRVAQEPAAGGPYFDGGGSVLTGAGVGIAEVDSGIDASHPDLINRVARNFKGICPTPGLVATATETCYGSFLTDSLLGLAGQDPITPLYQFVDVGHGGNSDTTSGHGTHVAGIVAGEGTASTPTYAPGMAPAVKGTFTGAAPGATLYGFGVGDGDSIFMTTEAYAYIDEHFDEFTPRIRVITNSWGDAAGTAYDPASVFSRLTKKLVEQRNVTVLFAAGNGDTTNNGGTGTDDRLSSTAKDPTPGVVSVANYDDANSGSRDNIIASSSSRGLATDPTGATWPDIAAPGTSITATCALGRSACIPSTQWAPSYTVLSGTSMATPHTAGAVALLLQAHPELTPPQIENLLQESAYKFAYRTNPANGQPAYVPDPQHPGATSSYDKGAGLLDVPTALNTLGVRHGTGSSAPASVAITSPPAGTVNDGVAPLATAGTAADGTSGVKVPQTRTLITGDAGDFSTFGAVDIAALRVTETPAGAPVAGLNYEIDVRNAADAPLNGGTLRLYENIGGVAVITNINIATTGVTAGTPTPATAVPQNVALRGNTVSFLLPFSGLPSAPAAGTPVHNLRILSYASVVVDAAPGVGPGAQTANAQLQYARPFTIDRPGTTTPAASVSASVDGGAAQPATLAGTTPSYTWSASIDTSGLADGTHTLRALLKLNGVETSTATTSFTVRRAPKYAYAVAITSPAAGDTMPRMPTAVTGTSTTDDPGVVRTTLALEGPAPVAEAAVPAGTSWTQTIDFDRTEGNYTLVARQYVDGVLKSTASRAVVVPAPHAGQVSYAAEGLSFWKDQYQPSSKARVFSGPELDALAARAVTLSSGIFDSRTSLVDALFVSGKLTNAQRATRSFAVLTLNLAGGDLSLSMSQHVGLSGDERLDPATYDTARLGATVNTATRWIRNQLPSGDLVGANSVATAINKNDGLR